MAKTRRAYTGGAVSTTTTSSIAASGTTSFTITAATGWPYGSDPFYVVVEPGTASEEKILVTRTGVGDTTINIASDSVRGLDGTAAVSHGSGVTTFPVFTSVDADEANELASKWSAKGDLVSYGSSTFEKLAVGSDGALLMADSSATSGLKWAQPGYTYVQTVYFTSNGTFTKATYPWLRAVKLTVTGGGGGGSSSPTSNVSSGAGGGGGGTAQAFVLASSLSASETVTIGAGGTGGAAGGNDGGAGGTSSFGSHAVATGGAGGEFPAGGNNQGGIAGIGTAGDLLFAGDGGDAGSINDAVGGSGGGSFFGGGAQGIERSSGTGSVTGRNAQNYGGGGGGGVRRDANAAGGDGSNGIVIVELFA